MIKGTFCLKGNTFKNYLEKKLRQSKWRELFPGLRKFNAFKIFNSKHIFKTKSIHYTIQLYYRQKPNVYTKLYKEKKEITLKRNIRKKENGELLVLSSALR